MNELDHEKLDVCVAWADEVVERRWSGESRDRARNEEMLQG
jgi:hypothetical protein